MAGPVCDHRPMAGPAERSGRAAPGAGGTGAGGPNRVVAAFAHSLARYRFVLAGTAAVLLGLALLPTGQPDRAARMTTG